MEGGTNFGVHTDKDPSVNHQNTPNHLVALLARAGIPWRSYQEDISGSDCPLTKTHHYVPRHNPMVFFDDVTNGNSRASATCIAHVRPYSELAGDLQHNTVARYNFITPNLCHDMHGTLIITTPSCLRENRHGLIRSGDHWLSEAVPPILASSAYKQGGALFITWDEGSCPLIKIDKDEQCSDGPVGMIVLAPAAKRGYANTITYTHSSTLRTIQEIFGVTPLLGDAKIATDLRDLFTRFP